ncbi:mechanosensitive ion channel family protein [Hydrogenimonas sp.]|uniref:mechanosensitive ion channel family protein n=1 Tax=Hydrogenimonas sp. TaxID=2231112 RepID=UPI0026264A2F|nr:mechanosensitive ion channel family protein [Hydrogenimonas sp.]
MKKGLLLLLISTLLFAATTFWETLIEIEKEFYSIPESQKETIVTPKERNETSPIATENAATKSKNGIVDTAKRSEQTSGPGKLEQKSNDLSGLADAKISKFNLLLGMMKERPYEVNNPNNPFYNPLRSEQMRSKMRTRIGVNKQYGYDLAVVRDEIALLELEARQQIYGFFVHLATKWTDMSGDDLVEMFKKYSEWLQSIDSGKYTKAYIEAKKKSDKISQQIVQNYEKLRMHYLFFSEFLEYVATNPSMLHYRSIMSFFRLDEIIDRINSIESFAKINTNLRHIHTDMGRLIIFILIMIIAWGSSYFLYFKLYAFLKNVIEKEYHEADEILLNNLNGMRRPFFILVLAFGFRMGLEVLFHPAPLPEKMAIFFYAVLLGTIAYIVIIIIDSLFFDYMVKKGELKNKQLRQELINLILSIIKVTIVIIAISMLLVRMGVNITGLIASLGIGGLAVALAAQNTLSNFFGLLKIIFDNSFSQGDWIETADAEGTVVEIGFISTMIRTFDNAMITVPNATLANSPLKNWSKRTVGRRIKMHIGVTYGSKREDIMNAIEDIEKMLLEHPGIASPKKIDRKFFKSRSRREKKLISLEDKYGVKATLLVYLDEFADSSMNILIYCFSKSVVWQEWLEVKQDVLLKVWEILDSHNLEFAFPSESIYFDPDNVQASFKAVSGMPKPTRSE